MRYREVLTNTLISSIYSLREKIFTPMLAPCHATHRQLTFFAIRMIVPCSSFYISSFIKFRNRFNFIASPAWLLVCPFFSWPMDFCMLTASNKLKVFNSIIKLIPIYMVDYFFPNKFSSEMFFHYKPMFKNFFSAANEFVSRATKMIWPMNKVCRPFAKRCPVLSPKIIVVLAKSFCTIPIFTTIDRTLTNFIFSVRIFRIYIFHNEYYTQVSR